MSDSIHHPQDKLFQQVFSDPVETASFLQAYLPESLSQRFDWSTLTLIKGRFIDDAFQGTESDMLYLVKTLEDEEEVFFYILFEHQSKPDKWMRFRFLKYMCRIWDESFKMFPKQSYLLPIVPVVFYQGENKWTYSTEFSDLFRPEERESSFIPHLTHFLVDQSGINSSEVKGALKAKIAQLLMLAAYHEVMEELFEILPHLLAQVPLEGGHDYIVFFVRYLADTQAPEAVDKLIELTRQLSTEVGGEMRTASQVWTLEGEKKGRKEGEKKGEIKGKIETIESFLKAGVAWDIIINATGITQEKLQELKAKLHSMMPNQQQKDITQGAQALSTQ
jgi:predicted transposase/invertase (TIGR01784 family)